VSRLVDGIRGCQSILTRCGDNREAFVLRHVLAAFLDALRAINEGPGFALEGYNRRVTMPVALYALCRCKGNQVKTAKLLGISRNNLRDNYLLPAARDPLHIRLADELGSLQLLPKHMQDRPIVYRGRLT